MDSGIVKTMLLRLTGRKKVIDEGQNLVFAKKPQTVGELAGDLNDWPPAARLFFEKDLKRYTHQLPPHFVTRLYIIRKLVLDGYPNNASGQLVLLSGTTSHTFVQYISRGSRNLICTIVAR
jgi:hypothetical protein